VVMEELWQSKLPLKLKIFIWLVHRNSLQTADNLGEKTMKIQQILSVMPI
jgi:hypothetical protein